METKSTTAFSAAIPVLELLDKHNNYSEWAIRMRTYLKGQDLWKVIIDKDENAPTYENDDVNDNGADDDDAAAAIKVWRRRNYMALHVIQISCGPDAFAEIRSFCSAKTAWQTLEKKYLIVLDTGNIGKSYLQYADLYRAVHRGNLTATKDFLDSQREAVSKAITNKGQTALHIAVTTGHAHIVKELVSRMSKEDFGIEDGDGYTALTTALVYERSELALYLYTFTLLNHGDLLVEKGRKGAMLLNHAIYSRNLDLALHLIRHFPSLTHAFDDRGESPLLALASMRNAFPSGNRLVFWKQWIYNRICIHPSALGTTIETRLNTPNVESGRQHNQVIQMESGNQSAPATFETRLRIPNVENGRQRSKVITRIKSVTAVLLRRLISVVLCLWAVPAVLLRCLISVVLYLWAAPVLRRDLSLSIHVSDLLEAILPLLEPLWSTKLVLLVLPLHLTPILLAAILKAIVQLYVMKKLHKQSQKLLSCMCEEISTSFIQTGQLENIGGVCDAITLAVKNGISEFVLKVARTHPSFLENKYRNSRNILMLAVLYRQSEIFSNIYHGFDMKNTLTSYGDCNDDNILHMVGMIEDSTMLNQISGAALQMQRELQWFKIQELRLENPNDVSDDIYALACGPDPWVQSFSACIMNGTRFHTVSHGQHRRTQNSGVVVKGEHQSKAVDFYGVLHDILQLQYMGWHHVYWFKYEWFDVGDAKRGIHVGDHVTSVNTSRKWYKGKPFALVCQATQVFYLQDNSKHGNWAVVQRVTSRNMYDVPTTPLETKDDDYEQNLNFEAFQENEPSYMVAEPENGSDGISSPLHRTDGELIDVVADTIFQQGISLPDDEDFIDDELNENDDYQSGSSEDLVTDSGNSSENGDVRLPVM